MPVLMPEKKPGESLVGFARKERRDLLVVQTREAVRRATRVRLRMLGLTGEGTYRVLASSSGIVRRLVGELSRSQSVEIRPLALSASRTTDEDTSMGTAMTQASYPVAAGEALQGRLTESERINFGPSDGQFSIAWTTGLPVETLLPRLQALLADRSEVELTVGVANGFETDTMQVADAVRRLVDAPAETDFWRIDLSDRSLTWERGSPTLGLPGPPFGLMGFIGERYDRGYLENLIQATATPAVGANAGTLLAKCGPVIDAANVRRPDLTHG